FDHRRHRRMRGEILHDDVMDRDVVALRVRDVDDPAHGAVGIAFALASEHRVPLRRDQRPALDLHVLHALARRLADRERDEQPLVPHEPSAEAPGRADGRPLGLQPKTLGTGIRYVAGGSLFGLGWALTGACPGPLVALVGAGVPVMAVAVVSALAGTWTYAALRPRLPH